MNQLKIKNLIRKDLSEFTPYGNGGSSGEKMVLLNANEVPFCPLSAGRLNRYPDPLHNRLKEKLSRTFHIPRESVFTGHGSDEVIDLLIRGFCNQGTDHIAVLPPSYRMYSVYASLNGIGVRSIPLENDFQPDPEKILDLGKGAKILFLCSPNNPTGNLIRREITGELLRKFPGLVVVDEAYIDFSGDCGWAGSVSEFPNLVVLRTLSKSWGLAGARVGFLAGDPGIVRFLDSIKPPYNLSGLSIDAAVTAMKRKRFQRKCVDSLKEGRESLREELDRMECVQMVYPSDANFLLVKFRDGGRVFRYLKECGILVRDVSSLPGCTDCLRISVGSRRENQKLLKILGRYRGEELYGKNSVS